MVGGLLLIPLGMWREQRRIERGRATSLVFDLGNPRHRNAALVFLVGTSVFLLVTTIGMYEGYHYTESVQFCGEVCHEVMAPERVAHRDSPHAKVDCVKCHIGPGAGWYVQSKISGARQVFKTALGTYPRPIPTPIRNLRPAQEVCEQCHWPQKFYAATQVTRDHYLGDEANTHWRISMLVKVGGAAGAPQGHPAGIHWHIDEAARMTYVAADGAAAGLRPGDLAQGGTGDRLHARGGAAAGLDPGRRPARGTRAHARLHGLPQPAVAHLQAADDGRQRGAGAGAARRARAVHQARGGAGRCRCRTPPRRGRATRSGRRWRSSTAAAASRRRPAPWRPSWALYERNMFPQMKARWDVYPDNRGHFIFPGCFRCHGSDLATADGRTISKDCNLCHQIVAQGPAGASGDTLVTTGLPFRHPVDIGGAETETPCFECHKGDASLY